VRKGRKERKALTGTEISAGGGKRRTLEGEQFLSMKEKKETCSPASASPDREEKEKKKGRRK